MFILVELENALSRLVKGDRESPDIIVLKNAVLKRMHLKIGTPKQDVWHFMRESCHYSDRDIAQHFAGQPENETNQLSWQVENPPHLPETWAEMLTLTLLRKQGVHCECADRYRSYGRKHKDMLRVCGEKHVIEYCTDVTRLHKALDGDSNLHVRQGGMYRGFGNSMFCAILTTPAESQLLLIKENNVQEGSETKSRWLLVDERTFQSRMEFYWSDDVQEPVEIHYHRRHTTTWVCHDCRIVLGSDGIYCSKKVHRWERVSVPDDLIEPWGDEMKPISVNFCKNKHVWPGRGIPDCPHIGCDEPSAGRHQLTFYRNSLIYSDVVR